MAKQTNTAGKRTTSALFEGHSIFKRLENSTFGTFRRVIESIDLLQVADFQLPRVVVIGSESVGKSSLLEVITKCAIFPRDKDICTKAPIRFQLGNAQKESEEVVEIHFRGEIWALTNPDAILVKMESVMKSIGDSITEDEIVVRIHHRNMPTFEFVDLPGIRAYPPKLAEATTSLVRKYIRDESTLVICVVDATQPSLGSIQALAFVKESEKLKSTILALTKVDLVAKSQLQRNVVDRVLRSSPEMEDLPSLAGCVAVVNRPDDRVSLQTAELGEVQWFETELGAAIPFNVLQNAAKHMTMYRLVDKVDMLYHNFICKSWKPFALSKLQEASQTIEKRLAELGPDPLTIDQAAVVQDVKDNIVTAWPTFLSIVLPTFPRLADKSGIFGIFPLVPGKQMREERVKIQQWFQLCKATAPGLQAIESCINAAFTSGPLKTERFTALRAHMLTTARDIFTRVLPSTWEDGYADWLLHDQTHGLYSGRTDMQHLEVIASLQKHIAVNVLTLVADGLASLDCAKTELFEEDESFAKHRCNLEDQLGKVQAARETIGKIESALAPVP